MAESRSSSTRKPSYSKRSSDDRRPSDRKPPRAKRSEDSASEPKPWKSKNFEDRGERKPRFEDHGERKPREGRPDRGGDRKPRFEDRDDRKPRFEDRGERKPRFEDRGDRKPRFEDRPERGERKPRFEDRGDRKPRFEDRGNRRPRFEDRQDEFTPQERKSRKVPEGADRLDEIKACGINACRAIFKGRKTDLVRAYVTEENMQEFGDMLKWCAANKKAYHIVTSDDLNKISGSTHHEGVCVIAKAKASNWAAFQEKLAATKTKPALLLILEDVGNPHNVGAMVRSAAHFGVSAILAPGLESFKPSPALLRTAEGGTEHVDIIAAPALPDLVSELKKFGFKTLATAANGKDPLYSDDKQAIPSRTAFIIGNESRGISATARKLADSTISIPGSGVIESLNVSVAAAVLCGEFWRRYKA